LCENVLQPVREHFGKSVTVNSGYRSPESNAAVGGSKTSDHCKGQAADIEIDGISTTLVSSAPELSDRSSIGAQHIVGLDHVVINTDNLDRTCTAIESVLGLEVRREREVGNGVVQRFHKLDNTIIEVVTGPHITTPGASLWGMVASVDDLFDLAEELGEDITSVPKRATQPGRFISTARGSLGLGVPFALMTPHVSGSPTQ